MSRGESGREREREAGRERSRGGQDWYCLSVKMPRVCTVYTVSPTRPNRLSRPPASLWQMYASGARLWLAHPEHGQGKWHAGNYYCIMFASGTHCTGRQSKLVSQGLGWMGRTDTRGSVCARLQISLIPTSDQEATITDY